MILQCNINCQLRAVKLSWLYCVYNLFILEGVAMPIIESIQVAAVSVPLDKVTSFSTRTVSERHYCIVKVRSKEGLEGI
jgi:hypothetical protein